MASGTNKIWTANFTAYVGDDYLLTIDFFWAGKGTFQEPSFSYAPAALSLKGPLVSGISVTASKELHSLNFVEQRFLLRFIWINNYSFCLPLFVSRLQSWQGTISFTNCRDYCRFSICFCTSVGLHVENGLAAAKRFGWYLSMLI
jgi:hypothetical protein